ncbi:MAG: hypothetical protein ACTSWI_01250, partial [Alphaproteobacteria bacterium]
RYQPPSPHDPASGHSQILDLKKRLSHFAACVDRSLTQNQSGRGPLPKKTLPAIVEFLAKIYEARTGETVTHTPREKTEYTGQPQSKAGKFMTTFFKFVDPDILPQTVSSALADLIHRRNIDEKRD